MIERVVEDGDSDPMLPDTCSRHDSGYAQALRCAMRLRSHTNVIRRASVLVGLLCCVSSRIAAQRISALVDSLRRANAIPEIGYAVVSAEATCELQVIGVRQAGTDRTASVDDRFRIGSITKTITSLIASRLVHEHTIQWDTRLFDLLPELRAGSNSAYRALTLRDLLSFRARLIPWTYTDPRPSLTQFTGEADVQRRAFLRWALQQAPVPSGDGVHFSNVAYVAAGAMLERASGKRYSQLVQDLGDSAHIAFGFGAPNSRDSLDTWGHREDGSAEAPGDNIRLEWLQPAGNLNMSLPELAAYARLHLQGLAGHSSLLDREAFDALHTGRRVWALGWKWTVDPDGEIRSFHAGNPGSFLSMVYLHHRKGRAFVVVSNKQSESAQESLNLIYDALRAKYDRADAECPE